ncbi:MAG: type II toxin-antitoxin system RelE/ParE family toxin [Alphaproteobacteria bacterium]
MMLVVFTKSATKVLLRMQTAKARDIREAVDRAAATPFAHDNNRKPLVGIPGGFRQRVGDWRVSFIVDTKADRLEVFEIAPRGGAYR